MTNIFPRKLIGKQCQCTVCGLVFSTETNFDANRYGKAGQRSCRAPRELVAMGYRENDHGIWKKAPPAKRLWA